MVKMYPDVWHVTVTSLWNIFCMNAETAEVGQKYYDAMMLKIYNNYSRKSVLHMYLTYRVRKDCFIEYRYLLVHDYMWMEIQCWTFSNFQMAFAVCEFHIIVTSCVVLQEEEEQLTAHLTSFTWASLCQNVRMTLQKFDKKIMMLKIFNNRNCLFIITCEWKYNGECF